MKKAIRLLCVDDHEAVLEGLRSRLRLEPDFEVVGQLRSADDLLAETQRCRPDVVVLDIAMPGTDPFEAAADLHGQFPDVRLVFLTAHLRDRYLDAAFRAGAWGYLFKGDALDEIVDSLRRANTGEFVISPRLLEQRPTGTAGLARPGTKRRSRLKDLTAREAQVLQLIGRGLSRRQIATTLHRSMKTVDTHRANIMKKLGIHDRTELALYAIREGLVDVENIDGTR